MSFLEKNKIPLAIIFSGIIIAVSIYFGLKSKEVKQKNQSSNTQSTFNNYSTPTSTITTIPTHGSIPNETEIPTPTTTVPPIPKFNEEQIKQGLLSKTIISEEKLEYSIGERLDRENKILIRGTVKNKDEEHGAGFFAYCDFQKCEVTFVGQEVPKCSEINPYGYPLDWADYCLDEKRKLIKR